MDAAAGIWTQNRLLGSLRPSTRASVDACGASAALERGMVLCRANQTIDHVWFIDRGVVSASHRLPDGAEFEVALIGAEGMVGALLALESSATPIVWRVCVAGTATKVARADFLSLLEEHPDFRAAVLAFAAALVRQISQAAACAAKHTISQRLARWILTCQAKAGQQDLEITHQSLARALGVRRAGVTAALHVLEGARAIRSVRGRVILKDAELLRTLACGCPTQFSAAPAGGPREHVGTWKLYHPLATPIAGALRGDDLAGR
jgi:CRP-like cAMP-binding protein